MGPGLTDKEMNRIKEYLKTPAYERAPQQLLPETASDAEDDKQ